MDGSARIRHERVTQPRATAWHAGHVLADVVAHDLALAMALEFEPSDADALAPLVDAALVWLDGDAREPITAAVAEVLWPRELREDIERGLDAVEDRFPHLRRELARARRDLDRGPRNSRLALAVVDQAADEAAFDLQFPVGCPHCLDEGIGRASCDGIRERTLLFARMAGHAARIPPDELQAVSDAVDPAVELATDERRADVRWWLRRIALLGQRSVPNLSAALLELLNEPLPEAYEDEVWREAVTGLLDRAVLREAQP